VLLGMEYELGTGSVDSVDSAANLGQSVRSLLASCHFTAHVTKAHQQLTGTHHGCYTPGVHMATQTVRVRFE